MEDKCPKCHFIGEMVNSRYYPEGTIKSFKCPNCLSFVQYDRFGKRYYIKAMETGRNYIFGATVSFFLGIAIIAYGFVNGYIYFFFGGGFLMICLLSIGEFLDKRSKYEALEDRMKEKMREREMQKQREEMLKTRVRIDETDEDQSYGR